MIQGARVPVIPGYEILGVLGRGAMGVVYRARQVRLNRQVALKMILAGDHAGPEVLARFLAEAATIARLRHPNIVQIYAIGDWDGRPYVELEYVEGGSLASRLDGKPWPPRSAARLLECLARAAAEAHRLGIVHRDLKPANILITEEGEPKISDFGLAKTLEEDSGLTRTESILGSPCYMAPEQAEGRAKDVGAEADIYALGANLYELLTGRPPFVGPTILATLDLVKNSEPVPPRRLQPALERDLETICLKCLEKAPQRRYSTADALAADLAAFLAHEPIRARRSLPWERAGKWIRRRPSTAALILVCCLGVLSAAGALSWRRADLLRRAETDRREVASLKEQADQFILLGRDAMRRKEWEASRTQLSSAMALIRSESRLAVMRDGVENLLALDGRRIAEQRAREEARARFSEFQRLYDEAVFCQSDFMGLDYEAGLQTRRASTRQALSRFGLGTGNRIDLALDPAHFDAREVDLINTGCYELTLLLAESVSQPLPGEDPARQGYEALEILETARLLRDPTTRAFHLRREAILARIGDPEGAAEERELAEAAAASDRSAVDQFLIGEQAYRRGDRKRAIEAFRRTLAIQPDRFWAQYFLAVCLLKEHRAAEAQAALIACQSRRPGFVWAYLLKGFAEGEMREFDLAEEDFQRANELHLNDQERYVMLVNRGVMRIRRGKDGEAADDLARAIALKPDQFEAYINLALAFQNLGQWENALTALGRAIEGHPRQAVLYRARSQVYRHQARPDDAIDDLRRAIALLSPDDPAASNDYLELGLIMQQAGRYEEALAACDRSLRLKPDRPDVHRVRGVVLMMLKRYDEAARSIDVCLARGSPSPALYEARGMALASHGSYDRAIADYTMALNVGRGTSSLYANRGWVYLLGGAPAPSLRDFDEAIRLDSSNAHALGGRALANVQLRKTSEAVADALASARLSPADARQVYNAARVHCQAAACLEAGSERGVGAWETAGRYRTEAIGLLTRAMELCPAADRGRFWNEVVPKDACLEPIRRARSFHDLAARVASTPASAPPGGSGR
jgi:eukaryotic-like serine/threonine-protein kinase